MSNIITLEATINPEGQLTTGWFEYTTDPYFNTWSETEHKIVGASHTNEPIKEKLTGLQAGQKYYYRVAFDNGKTTTKGAISTFQTEAATKTSTVATTINTGSTKGTNSSSLSANALSATSVNPGRDPVTYQNAANSLLTGSFLPNGLGGWIILIILIVAITTVAKRLAKKPE